jgi:hypothetical protein
MRPDCGRAADTKRGAADAAQFTRVNKDAQRRRRLAFCAPALRNAMQ